MPPGALRVSESGIHDAADIVRLRAAGYHGVPGGRAPDEIRRPRGGAAAAGGPGMIVKICGITNREDAEAAIAARRHRDRLQFLSARARATSRPNWPPASPPPGVRRVGVFVNEAPARIAEIARSAALDVAQLHGDETPAEYPAGARGLESGPRRRPASIFRDWTTLPAEALLLDGPAPNSTAAPGRPSTGRWPRDAAPAHHPGRRPRRLQRRARHRARAALGRRCLLAHRERRPGRKDHVKMTDFLQAAKAALRA